MHLEIFVKYNHIVGDYSQNRLELFNKYNSAIKSTDEAVAMIEAIKHVFRKMVTVYESVLYNLWGFVQFSKSLGDDEALDIYSCLGMSEQELKRNLIRKAIKRIPNLQNEENCKDNYKVMRYQSRNDKLTNLLLSFNVFMPMKESTDFRFRFYDYEKSKWSFEHISPQNPKGAILIPKYAKMYVIREIDKLLSSQNEENERKNNLEQIKKNVLNDKKIDANDVEFLFDSNVDEHSLGNMALLTREDNSANNNNPFMIKKLIIQGRKGNGAFIPNHTYEVFNKILVSPSADISFSAESFIWGQKDVDAHIQWMNEANKNIINWLKEEANL